MSSTEFWAKIDPDSELGKGLSAMTEVPGQYVSGHTTAEGIFLNWDKLAGRWYAHNDDYAILTMPDHLRRSSLEFYAISATRTNVPIDDKSPFCASYVGEGQFEGYSALVWTYNAKSGAAAMSINVTGPPAKLEDFYNEVVSRKMKPTAWKQPKPWWWRLRHPLG